MARLSRHPFKVYIPACWSLHSHPGLLDWGSWQTLSHLRAFARASPPAWNVHPWALHMEAPSGALGLREPFSNHPVDPSGHSQSTGFSFPAPTRILELCHLHICLFVFFLSHLLLSDKIQDTQLNLSFKNGQRT